MRTRFRTTIRSLVISISILSCPLLAQQPTPHLLRHARDVRSLTLKEATAGWPVRLRGVVTDDIPAPDFFIQDGSAGIYVEGRAGLPHPQIGDWIELTGVSGPGHFAPVVQERQITILGRAPLPPAHLLTYNEVANGQQDSQWGALRGIVRQVYIDRRSWREPTLALVIASGGGEVRARVPLPSPNYDPTPLVDSSIRLEGVCGAIFNDRRQLTGVLFYVPRMSFITVEAPAPPLPISSLMRFSPNTSARHRVRILATVSFLEPGSALYLQNGVRALRVLTSETRPVSPGDHVEVLGFPALGDALPILEDAVYRKVGHGALPEPLDVDAAHLLNVTLDARLVRIRGTLVAESMRFGQPTLLLRSGGQVLTADLSTVAAKQMATLQPGSLLSVTGICLLRSGGIWHEPKTVRLLIRTAADVQVLRTPAWWTRERIAWLLAAALLFLGVVVLWLALLGRKFREQIRVLHQKLRHGAVLQERHRIARELHDTLEQDLAAITLHLDLAVARFREGPEHALPAVEMARNMSRHSMQEARRSVWDLRCEWLENGDLVSALQQALAPSEAGAAEVDLQVRGKVRRLDPQIEMNLLRIAQEAVCNARRHAGADHIVVELDFDTDPVSLSVADNGRGFDEEYSAAAARGHFGLLDMQERAHAVGCELWVRSEPGATRITVQGRNPALSANAAIPINQPPPKQNHADSSYAQTTNSGR